MNNPHGLQIFQSHSAVCDFQQDHLCADCWDTLLNYPDHQGGYFALCCRCGENTRGYVSKKYIQRRMERGTELARIAKDAMKDFIPWLRPQKKKEEASLKDLGF